MLSGHTLHDQLIPLYNKHRKIPISVHLAVPHVRKPLHGEIVLLWPVKVLILQLGLVDPGRGQRWDAHSVADEDDDVLGHALVPGDGGEGVVDLLLAKHQPIIGILGMN